MPLLPINPNTTQSLIDKGFAEEGFGRGYMGMSGIGNPCLRALQLQFRMTKKSQIGHRLNRIFNTGHIAERFMIADLNRIGIETFYRFDADTKTPMTGAVGEKQEEIIGFAGHWKGHIDGRCLGVIEAPKTEHLLEMKTHNDKSFNAVKKDGVKRSKPMHYDQMTRYMSGTKLKRALYMAYNKNTSEYHFERVRYDPEHGAELKRKEQIVLMEENPFPRIGTGKPSWHECKFCGQKDICFSRIEPARTCGTCEHRDVYDEGVFKCGRNDKDLTWDDQVKGCDHHQIGVFFQLL